MAVSETSITAENRVLGRKDQLRFELEIHDRQQLEIECTYPLNETDLATYQMDMYLFVPRNVGVNAQNYSTSTFYTDLIGYLRMDSPALNLMELSDPFCSFSPLSRLRQAIEAWEQNPSLVDTRSTVALIKLFGHAFRESVQSEYLSLQEDFHNLSEGAAPNRTSSRQAVLKKVTEWTQFSSLALEHFRIFRRRLSPLEGTGPLWAREIIEQVHEYTTAYFIEKLGTLSSEIQENAQLHDGSGFVASALSQIGCCAKQIASVRKQEGFVNPDSDSPRTAEFSTYRRGLIKKALQQAFYLETRHLKRDEFKRNASAMLAAGLAAVWTLFIFPWFVVPSGASRTFSSWSSFIFVGLMIVAYALRDRFQEFSRNFFFKKLRSYDHDTAIVGENLAWIGLEGIRGGAREKMMWSTPDRLPNDVVYLRTHPRTVTGTDISTEEVLVYQRILTAGPQEKTTLAPGFSVRDALRLNLRHFMIRLDDPWEPMRYYDLNREAFVQVISPKVYHLNLIVRVTEVGKKERFLSRHRIVINKEQIVRLEQVKPVGIP